MLEITHSRNTTLSDIMLEVQKAKEFPIVVKVGDDTVHIDSEEKARMFSLGIFMSLECKAIEKDWWREGFYEDQDCAPQRG